MGVIDYFRSGNEDLYPEETQKMRFFLNNNKFQDFCFNDNSRDKVYELLKKYMKKELINFFESNKSKAIEIFNQKIREKNQDYDLDNVVSEIIKIEDGENILTNKIISEINELNLNKNIFEINYFTVLVLGKTGVGKSTLINSLLQLEGEEAAEEGVGNITTSETRAYRSNKFPFLRLVDTRGIEINTNFGAKEIQDEAAKYIKDQYNTDNINNFVQCIWYCITGNRFENDEIELIKKLRETYSENKIPVIIVYTQSINSSTIEKMKEYIKSKDIDAKFISVLAKRIELEDNKIESFGLTELIKETLHRCKKALKGENNNEIGIEMGTVITKKIGDYILDKILKDNKNNNYNSYKRSVNQFISLYTKVKTEDEFIYFIIYILGISINSFLNINQMKEKTFNTLKSLSIIQKNCYDFIKFYNNYSNDLIEPVLKPFSINFLDYQVEIQKQANKEIKLQNKKNIKEFSELISIFLTHNYYYLAQIYFIYNLISTYCPKLSKSFEIHFNELTKTLISSRKINEKINDCFLKKFKEFQKRVNNFYSGFNYSYFENNKEAKIKINMQVINNNLSLSRINSNSGLNSQIDSYKEDINELKYSESIKLPSYNELLKENNNDGYSAPSANNNN